MRTVRFREDPRPGEAVAFAKPGGPARVPVRLSPSAGRDSTTTCLEQWLLETFAGDPAGQEPVSVAVRRLASREEDPPATTDASFVVLWRKRVVARVDHDVRILPEVGLLPRRTIRTRAIPSGARDVLFVRTDSSDIEGSERYLVFGPGPSGAVQQYSGPTEYFRDSDLPATLQPGQVVYAHVRIAWFTVPLPLTFEPQRARFVPEVGDDAMFSASGKAVFQGDATGSTVIRLFLSTDPGASSVSVPIPPRTEATAKKAYLPFLVPGRLQHLPPQQPMVYVTVGSLEGWLPDSLLGRFTP